MVAMLCGLVVGHNLGFSVLQTYLLPSTAAIKKL